MKNVAVFFGGVSPEHDISIVTAIASVIKPLLLTKKYHVIPIYIAKNGNWYSHESFKNIEAFSKNDIDKFCAQLKPVVVQFYNGLTIGIASGLRTKTQRIDIAFPATHGANGEDGSLMGVLRMANIPFVGCDMEASVIAMDKVLAKQVAESNGIAVARYEHFTGSNFNNELTDIVRVVEKSLKYPLFVKPTHLGSSIGIERAKNTDELKNAIEVAAYYDHKIIIEEEVENLIEVTVPIIGNKVLRPGLVERPLVQNGEMFDFNTKYMSGGKKTGGKQGAQGYSELPANLPKKLYEKCVETAKNVYIAVGCEGIARIDLLIDSKTEIVYFNELNPLPGSLYAHNWRAAGVSTVELVTQLVEYAQERYDEQQKATRTFSTNFLKQF